MEDGDVLTPFLGVYLLIVNVDIDLPQGSFSDTDVDVELRTGLRYTLASDLDLYGSFHLGRDALFALGFVFDL
jgi:hypothetical protein